MADWSFGAPHRKPWRAVYREALVFQEVIIYIYTYI
jgi:hypothetical protein